MIGRLYRKLLRRALRLPGLRYDDIAELRLAEQRMEETGTEFLYRNRFGYYTTINGQHYLNFVFEHQFPNDCYDILDFLAARDDDFDVVIDVGACLGVVSLYCGLRSNRVIAVEAHGANIDRIHTNIALNEKLLDRSFGIEVVQYAITSRDEPQSFHESDSIGHGSLRRIRDGSGAVLQVEGRTLDRLCEEREVAHVDLLKIDVEGAELDVLRGGAGLLARQAIGLIIFEASFTVLEDIEAGKQELIESLALLHAHGYEVATLDGRPVDASIVSAIDDHFVADFVATPVSPALGE